MTVSNEAREALEAEKARLTGQLNDTLEKLRGSEAEVVQLRRDVEGLQQRLQETGDAAKRREEALTLQLEAEANKHQKEVDVARKQLCVAREEACRKRVIGYTRPMRFGVFGWISAAHMHTSLRVVLGCASQGGDGDEPQESAGDAGGET